MAALACNPIDPFKSSEFFDSLFSKKFKMMEKMTLIGKGWLLFLYNDKELR